MLTAVVPLDALGNRLDTSPSRAHQSPGITRAGKISAGCTGSPTAYPNPAPATAATPHPIAVPRTSRLTMPATLTTQRSSLISQPTPAPTYAGPDRFRA